MRHDDAVRPADVLLPAIVVAGVVAVGALNWAGWVTTDRWVRRTCSRLGWSAALVAALLTLVLLGLEPDLG